MKKENIEELKTYLGEVGNLFSQRKKSCIDLIFALLTNHGTRAKTVVELSLSRFFKRQYSSISCAISGYFTSRKNNEKRDELWKKARDDVKSFLLDHALEGTEYTHSFAIDITGNIKKHSVKIEDRSYIHSGSIGGISIGHNYSVIGKKEEGGWMLPVVIDRIPHSENKYEFSVSQVEFILDKVPDADTSILVEDSVN